MEQNQNSKIQKLLEDLSHLQQSFINNIATKQQYGQLKQLCCELYLLADLASDKTQEAPGVQVQEIQQVKEINDFYNPVEMVDEYEIEPSTPHMVVEEVKMEVPAEPVKPEEPEPKPKPEPKHEPEPPPVVIEKPVPPMVSSPSVQFSKLLSLSKKFEYTRSLFGGDGGQLEAFLLQASSQSNKADLKKWFNNQIAAKGWGNKVDMCEELLVFMQRHLP